MRSWEEQVNRWARHGSLPFESANQLVEHLKSQQAEIERLRKRCRKQSERIAKYEEYCSGANQSDPTRFNFGDD